MPNQPQEIKIADNFAGAEYINMAQFNHNKEEFQLFLFNIAGATGRVVSKVITNPSHFKRMVMAMQDNIKKYEEAFGPIDADTEIKRNLKIKN